MPDTRRAGVCKKLTIFCIGPSSWTIEIHSAFHAAVLKIEHAAIYIPRTYRVPAKCFEAAIDRAQPRGVHGPQCHLMACIRNLLLVVHTIGRTAYRYTAAVFKAIIVQHGE